jgi:hypothetical protein
MRDLSLDCVTTDGSISDTELFTALKERASSFTEPRHALRRAGLTSSRQFDEADHSAIHVDPSAIAGLNGKYVPHGSRAAAFRGFASALAEAVEANMTRLHELFHAWDDDGSGTISRAEWRQAMEAIGLHNAPPDEIDKLVRRRHRALPAPLARRCSIIPADDST